MTAALVLENGIQLPLSLPPITLEEFAEFCRRNPDLQAERTAEGELRIMPPAEAYGDSRNVEITIELGLWNRKQHQPGIVFGQSAGFTLPNSAVLSPDAAWLPMSKWQALTDREKSGFAHVCPDFVVELMSPSDRLKEAQAKMDEYIANGAKLGWLIDRRNRVAYIYRPNTPPQTINNPTELTANPELPGFVLPMNLVF